MGTASIASAIAVKKAMEAYGIAGTIKVFGSPAEETVVSRPYMVRAGLFEGVDVVIDNHSGDEFRGTGGRMRSALFSTIFTFKGRTAHSAGEPWNGRSALDAVELMNVATNYMREHQHYGYRLHYVVVEGGEAPNVVPDKASVWYFVRNSDERIEEMYEWVVDCAKAAALATQTELAEVRCLTAIHQCHYNMAGGELIQKNVELVGMPQWTEQEHAYARALQKELEEDEVGMPTDVNELKVPEKFVGGGSSDVGEVTLVAPTGCVLFPGRVPGAVAHHWSTVSCNYGSTAWKGLNAGAKVIAASAIDLMTSAEELKKVREEFEELAEKNPYKSLLPEDAEPPLGLNEELMGKWRGLMETMYLDAD
jgi:aminobenzoyl-glutamate utilization protein B